MPIFFIIFFSCPLQSTRNMHLMQTFGCMEGLAVGRGDPSIEGQIHKIKLQYQNWRAPLHQDKSTASKSTFFMSSSNTRKLILSHPFQLSQSTVDIPIKYSDTACTNIMYYFKKITNWSSRCCFICYRTVSCALPCKIIRHTRQGQVWNQHSFFRTKMEKVRTEKKQ